MKKSLLIVGMLLAGLTQVRAQTQMEMNEAACQKLRAADQKLNTLYKRVLTLYASDALFLKAFKASQVAWLKFRDAQEEALYPTQPGETKPLTYGSAYLMCSCPVLADLTTARNRQLQVWIDGTQEGDVCGGSVRTK